MNELQAILEAFELSQKSGEIAFLATVVNTQGSTYRQPGARMLITTTRMVGAISGGVWSKMYSSRLNNDRTVINRSVMNPS